MRYRLIPVVAAIAMVPACSSGTGVGQVPASGTPGNVTTPSEVKAPGFKVEEVAGGLEHGWDVGFLPDGKVLVSQRTGKFALLSSGLPGAAVTDRKSTRLNSSHER